VALIALSLLEVGGNDRSLYELIVREHRRFDFVVISPTLAPALRPLVDWKRVPAPSRPAALRMVVFWLLGGWRVRRTPVDVVHAQGAIVPNRVDLASVHFCHAGFVSAVGRLASPETPVVRRAGHAAARALALAAERWCYRPGRVRRLAAVSRGIAAELARHYPLVPTIMTPNGIDTTRFAPDPGARETVRRQLEVADDEVVLLFVGGDWDRKGLAVAVEAIAQANRKTATPLRLWVVGRGDVRRFSTLAQARGVGSNVHFFGADPRPERFYQAADIFVLPTEYEAFPLAMLEAAASGLPLVVTRVNGVEELFGDGEAGRVVERGAGSLAEALVHIAGDAGTRQGMGQAARDRASRYTWDRSAASVVEAYAECRQTTFAPDETPLTT
jgi:UDP-glucose:(heptosyl)LPS alpha-1,3-glucosyltransferase